MAGDVGDLLTQVRNYLVAQGLVRKPSVAGSTPPLWIAPADGVPAPGEGENPTEVGATLVLGMRGSTGIPRGRYVGRYLRVDGIEFVVRARAVPTALPEAYVFEQALKRVLDDRQNWTAGALQIHESLMFRALQPVTSSRAEGYTMTTEYTFERWVDGIAAT